MTRVHGDAVYAEVLRRAGSLKAGDVVAFSDWHNATVLIVTDHPREMMVDVSYDDGHCERTDPDNVVTVLVLDIR